MTDALLFLHVLSAAALFAGVFAYSAVVLGARLDGGASALFFVCFQGGLVGVFVFGLALAIDLEGVDPWSAWVLIAIVLWLAAGGTGDRVSAAFREAGGGAAAFPAEVARLHWLNVAIVLLLLADMIWKPFA